MDNSACSVHGKVSSVVRSHRLLYTIQDVALFKYSAEDDRADLPTFDMCALMSIKVYLVIDTRCHEPQGRCREKIRDKTDGLKVIDRIGFPSGQKS